MKIELNTKPKRGPEREIEERRKRANIARVDRHNRAGAARLNRERKAELARQEREAREQEKLRISDVLAAELPAHDLARMRLLWVDDNSTKIESLQLLSRVDEDLQKMKIPAREILGLRRLYVKVVRKVHGDLASEKVFTAKVLLAKYRAASKKSKQKMPSSAGKSPHELSHKAAGSHPRYPRDRVFAVKNGR